MNSTIASFGGRLLKLSHDASTTGCRMNLNLFLPSPSPTTTKFVSKVLVLFYLAGLRCMEDNGAEKGFFQHGASHRGIAIVYPDTSPCGLGSSSSNLPRNRSFLRALRKSTRPKVAWPFLKRTAVGVPGLVPASTSMPPNRLGMRDIECIRTSPRIYPTPSSLNSRNWALRGLISPAIVWEDMEP